MEKSLMTSAESWYQDILITRGTQSKHLMKETKILQIEAAKLGRSDGKIDIGKSILPKGSTLCNLPVYFDFGENVIHLRSRLHWASVLDHNFTNPIILPKGLAAEQLVLDAHQRWMHASQKWSSIHSVRNTGSLADLCMWRILCANCARNPVVST